MSIYVNISKDSDKNLSISAVFVVQFLLLSVCFGIPLMTFFMSTGQYLGSGLIDMWRISPIFQVKILQATGPSGRYAAFRSFRRILGYKFWRVE